GILRKRAQELRERVETARRGADADDGAPPRWGRHPVAVDPFGGDGRSRRPASLLPRPLRSSRCAKIFSDHQWRRVFVYALCFVRSRAPSAAFRDGLARLLAAAFFGDAPFSSAPILSESLRSSTERITRARASASSARST